MPPKKPGAGENDRQFVWIGMPRACTLSLTGIQAHRGRCPWRIEYLVDKLPVSAFYRPPAQIEDAVGPADVALLGLPILCDLAAEVRPRTVRIQSAVQAPSFRRIFADATGALLAEQDADWNRSRWTPIPALTGAFVTRRRSVKRLDANRVVLGFSGGKDSIVSLFALLEAGYDVTPVLLNEGDRTWQDLRRWIPKLRRLGLTPMLAYLTVGRRAELHRRYGDWHYSSYQIGWLTALLALCAERTGAAIVCLGIESSADYTFERYRNKYVNHQYQKTTGHLMALERFYRRVLNDRLRIASPIASITDAQVIRILLERVPASFRAFSSCGGANTRSKHCGNCAKCAFVYVLLSTSRSGRELARRIFRSDLLEDVDLYRPWLDARFKAPLACIGSRREVWDAFETLLDTDPHKPVVRKWQSSALRKYGYHGASERISRRHPKTDRRLTMPLERAARLVGRWLDPGPKRLSVKDLRGGVLVLV